MLKKISKRNLIFFTLIFISIANIVVLSILGAKQDARFIADNEVYQNATNMLNQGRYFEAEYALDNLIQTYPNDYMLQWNYAISLFSQGKIRAASQAYDNLRAQRPLIVNDQDYLVQHGQVLYALGDYKNAQKEFLQALKINPGFTNKLQPILNQIKNK